MKKKTQIINYIENFQSFNNITDSITEKQNIEKIELSLFSDLFLRFLDK